MKVFINKLSASYNYSNEVEEYLGDLIAGNYHVNYHDQTTGYNPEYDFKLNDKKVEVKFTSKSYPTIEFARADYRASALLLSEADYYLMISPGGSRNKYVGKIRLLRRKDLLERFIRAVCRPITSGFRVYPADSTSPGSMCFTLNPQDIDDIWLGDCDLIMSTNKKVIGFDLGTVGFTGKTLNI